jgi:hypothetical protein
MWVVVARPQAQTGAEIAPTIGFAGEGRIDKGADMARAEKATTNETIGDGAHPGVSRQRRWRSRLSAVAAAMLLSFGLAPRASAHERWFVGDGRLPAHFGRDAIGVTLLALGVVAVVVGLAWATARAFAGCRACEHPGGLAAERLIAWLPPLLAAHAAIPLLVSGVNLRLFAPLYWLPASSMQQLDNTTGWSPVRRHRTIRGARAALGSAVSSLSIRCPGGAHARPRSCSPAPVRPALRHHGPRAGQAVDDAASALARDGSGDRPRPSPN